MRVADVLRVHAAQWVEVGDVDVDIGANPSAEEAEEGLDSGAKKVVNLQDAFRLQEGPSYSKKELMTYLKVPLCHLPGPSEA